MFDPIKNGMRFSRDPIAFLSDCQQQHGDYQLTQLGGNRVFLVFDPKIARLILGDALTFRKTKFVYDKIKPITGATGLVQIEGEAGLKLRQAFNGFFNQASLDCYLDSARTIVEKASTSFEGVHDVRQVATEMVLGTALAMFAGVGEAAETARLSEHFLRLNDLCAKEFKNLLPLNNPLRKWQISKVQAHLDRAIEQVIRGECDPRSLIQAIRDGSSEIPMQVSDQFVTNQLKTFLFAGHETTATYLIMALYELSKNQDLQQRVRQELAQPDQKTGATSAFLREILRLYPPAWMIVRESTKDGEIDGRPYRMGDYFFIGVHQIHRHPDYWHDPLRLNLDNEIDKNIAFLPYGFGKRHCIGSRLADLELKMILGILLERYQLDYRGDEKPIRSKVMITAYPDDPVRIQFSTR